jgi:hypothetical protein
MTMPIRPERQHLYPANWKTEIVPMIRKRSGCCCEVCGVKNGREITRSEDNQYWAYVSPAVFRWSEPTALEYEDDERFDRRGFIDNEVHSAEHGDLIILDSPQQRDDWKKPIKIILTVAHLNHDETDNRPENLMHLCQLHHNRHDAEHRAANAKARREREANKLPASPAIISR